MHRNLLKTSFLALSFLISSAPAQQSQLADPVKFLTAVTDQMLRNPPASDWLMSRRTYDAWGYSPLDQINKDKVNRLEVAWTWAMTNGATEITPIGAGGILFVLTYDS